MNTIPPILQSARAVFKKHFADCTHPLRDVVEILLASSDYACRQVNVLSQLLSEDDCQEALSPETCHQLAEALVDQPFAQFARTLRHFRHRQLLRLLIRELAGLADTQETMRTWSDVADALILRSLVFCQQELTARYGIPCDENGQPTQLYTLAMGKLGGRELNYSSDIDLIFAYSASGQSLGGESLSNEQFYSKLIQLFIKLLQTITTEGLVFRVDLRLRPNGESGALVSSLRSLETYYQEQGRDWERYAMAKARLINRPADPLPPWFDRLIIPFVYRRYVDFSVIESLRSMKALIEREIRCNPRLDDIKRGRGGIREVEFIIQNIQLIRGGRMPQLRCQNAIEALDRLHQEKLLSRTEALKKGYLFLRKLENCLQSENDQQTHLLPADEIKRARITLAMGYKDWDKLIARLEQFQRIISTMFHAALAQASPYEDSHKLLNHQLVSLWQGHVESQMAINLLGSLGYEQPERCYQMIHAFRHAPRCRRLNQAVRIRLDKFMVLLLNELTQVKQTASVLLQVMHLLENIVGRSAYLALLTENPSTLKELLYWFEHSPFITSLLVQHPFLLEELLSKERIWRPPSRADLDHALNDQLSHAADLDAQEEVLRQFKLKYWLLVARAEMDGQVSAARAGRFLADVAQVIVTQVLARACDQLRLRYPEISSIKTRFAMIAYGKLGSMEMNFNSDLDLVFVHTARPEEEAMVNRLTQKIIHMLTARSQSGLLYQVDTRLRPSGSAGLLVSPLHAFLEYQRSEAWTWEHQALIRARILSGSHQIRQLFIQLKADVLMKKRDRKLIREEVQAMRLKMTRHLEQLSEVKQQLLDLEFLVQFLVLCYPIQSIKRYTNTLSLMQQLSLEKIITAAQFKVLKKAYLHYHHQLHQQVLINNNTLTVSAMEKDPEQAKVVAVIHALYESL